MCDEGKCDFSGMGSCMPSDKLGERFGCAEHAKLREEGELRYLISGNGA